MRNTTEELENAVKTASDQFVDYYLDWVNNWLTVDSYASNYGLTESEALQRIRIGKTIYNQKSLKKGR